jgi:hypothetical protein
MLELGFWGLREELPRTIQFTHKTMIDKYPVVSSQTPTIIYCCPVKMPIKAGPGSSPFVRANSPCAGSFSPRAGRLG